MQIIPVKDVMVPIADFTTVSQAATLYDAAVALQASIQGDVCKEKTVLVMDGSEVLGKITDWDVLWALEPKYKEVGDLQGVSRFGLYPGFIKTMMGAFDLLQLPLDFICAKAGDVKVTDIMRAHADGEYIKAETSINEAIHQFVLTHHDCLLVRDDDAVIGVLRRCDVFMTVCEHIKACGLK